AFLMRYVSDAVIVGKKRRVLMPLGRYGKDGKAGLSLAEACDAHDAELKLIEKGKDPIEERKQRRLEDAKRRQEAAGADTVTDLVDRFARDVLASRKRPNEAKQLLKSNLVDAKIDGEL